MQGFVYIRIMLWDGAWRVGWKDVVHVRGNVH